MKPKEPKILSKTRSFQGKTVHVDQYSLDFAGSKAEYELIGFDVETAVSALPILNGKLVLIKHFQLGIGQLGWSIPTGGLHKGEDPKDRMQLELQEEIGYKANSLELLTRTMILPSYLGTQPSYLYLAKDLEPSVLPGDEEFEIEIHQLDPHAAFDMVLNQEILDTRTCLAISIYKAAMA